MKQAIFWVTSLAGLRKLTFKQKVKSLMNDQIQITIVLAMVHFDQYASAQRILQGLFQRSRLDQLNVVSLADLVADKSGIEVAAGEQFSADFESLPTHRFDSEETTVRYINDGEIVAEVSEDVNQNPLLKTRFVNQQPVQSAAYQAGEQFGILSYADGQLSQALLLNQQGQLVTRFIRHTQPVNLAYTMGRTSKLTFTDMVSETDTDQHVIYQSSEVQSYYEVISYQNYDRFDSVYSYYASLLENVVTADSGLFIDLNDNPRLTPYLPQQLIFNY
ncbi:hypothetical protein HC026_04830 [Lactobacillus sp. LC28-10]|uniref:Regulatory protein YycH-like domain-containing protein n=1 Tax=Secundilactobacillus angelensis TaxID=2722706 RepID=A0ABX1KYE5_9LACO|nr:hypothetical protein [Secundilactobacillus angelensis]MCH5462559.1 hypothetical protein [Secundilactobacillus angelensis]NLR18250.1 hypothetical protein [Secundilactobacillus angelensis]